MEISDNRGGDVKKINLYVFLDSSSESWTFVNFIFHARFFTRALSVEEQAYMTFLADEKDVSVKGISQKTELHLLLFDQQIIHETFAEFSERVTHALNNFPIAEIDKTINVNE